MVLSVLLAALIALAGDSGRIVGGQIVDAQGNRIGVIRPSPYGGVDVYDAKGNRIGVGRESPIDGSIRVYDPKSGKPLYEIRGPRR